MQPASPQTPVASVANENLGWLRSLPLGLVVLRGLIAPCLLVDALDHQISPWFLVGFTIAFLSDIFDGIVARRLGISTAGLRQADGWADVTLYGCVAASMGLVYPQVVLDFQWPLLLVVTVQVLLFTISWLKFRKFPSYHTYTAKAWGLTLFAATIALFGFHYAGFALGSAIALGLINSLEEIAMTLILPEWTHDVLSIGHALKLKRDRLTEVSPS